MTSQFELIAAIVNRDVETLFNLAQVNIQLTTKGCQITRIVGF
jgi:hypothetical protein